MVSFLFALILLATTAVPAAAGPSSLDPARAARALEEAHELCRRDGGHLWGVSLCGPILLVDPTTREVAANGPDSEGRLEKHGEIYTGRLPQDVPTANTSLDWAGEHWTMLRWPLPENRRDRQRLVAHELFHRIQGRLGIPMANPSNNHLDAAEGRLWMRLEWRALARALKAGGKGRKKALRDALLFRSQRRALFAASAVEEPALELNEGLAEYTGIVLSAGSAHRAEEEALERLQRAPREPTFVRSFAYATGPAYGLLLDAVAPGWRRRIAAGVDLGALARQAYGIQLPLNPGREAERRAGSYGGEKVRREEVVREKKRIQQVALYRGRFVEGPVLVLPLEKVQVSFDPGDLVPLGPDGTVYPSLTASDVWGVLHASGGAFLAVDWSRIQVPAAGARQSADGRTLTGAGWKLELEPGWGLRQGPRAGDLTLQRGGGAGGGRAPGEVPTGRKGNFGRR